MKRAEWQFVLTLAAAAALFGAVIVENYRLGTGSDVPRAVDVEEVKTKIRAAGLEPHPARHWINIE